MSVEQFESFNSITPVLGELINAAALALFLSGYFVVKRRLKTALLFAGCLGILAVCEAADAPSGASTAIFVAAAAIAPVFGKSKDFGVLFAIVLYLNTRAQSGVISQSLYHMAEVLRPYPTEPLEAVFAHAAFLIVLYLLCFTALLAVMLILLNKRLKAYRIDMNGVQALYLCLYPAAGIIFALVVSRILIEPGKGEPLILFDRHPQFQALFPILGLMFYLGAYIMVVAAQQLAQANDRRAMLTADSAITRRVEERLEELNLNYEKLQTLKHDIGSHLNTVNALVVLGKSGEAAGYMEKLVEEASNAYPKLATGNPIADAVIGDFVIKCAKADIDFECDFTFNSDKIEAFDIAVILTNLLTNAYEACTESDDADKFIKLKSAKSGGFYIIEVVNSSNFVEIMPDGSIKSTKLQAGAARGIGLKSVGEKVRKYNGEASFLYKNKVFEAIITLQEGVAEI